MSAPPPDWSTIKALFEQVTALPPDRWLAVDALLSAHAPLDRPGHLGRGIGRPD